MLKSELVLTPKGDTISYYEYDKKGNMTLSEKPEYVKNGHVFVSIKFVYDKHDRLVEKIRCHDGREVERRKYVYNYKGKEKSESNDPNVKTFYLETDKYGNPLNYSTSHLIDDVEVEVKQEYTYFE